MSTMLARALPLVAVLAAGLTGCARNPSDGRDMVFCYRTLADVACYDRPDRGREGSFVGAYALEQPPLDSRAYWLRRLERQAQGWE